MRKITRHLFLRLYKHDYKGFKKPLTMYIKDFDKTIPLRYYSSNNTSKTFQKNFRNLDELLLYKNAIINILFAIRYLIYLQKNDTYEDISLQQIFELSLLTDEDKKPNTKAFKSSYFTDSRRKEINIYQNYYRLLLWDSMGITDLEFSRRVSECLINSNLANRNIFTLDDDVTFKSPYINYDKSTPYIASPSDITNKQFEVNKKLKEIEEQFLIDIDAPKNGVYFDGNKITVLIPNSPISLMFDLKPYFKKYSVGGTKKEHNYDGSLKFSHSTELQPSFINKRKSERSGHWWNGRTAWDTNWLKVIDETLDFLSDSENFSKEDIIENLSFIRFILLLKNNGNVKKSGKNIQDVISEYTKKRNEIKKEYKSVINGQIELATSLLHSYRRREVAVYFQTEIGYIVAYFKPYKIGVSKKLETRAEFYDNDFKKVESSSHYTNVIFSEKQKEEIYNGVGNKKEKLRREITKRTFEVLFRDSNPISIDYSHPNTSQYLKELNLLTTENDGTQMYNHLLYPLVLFKSKLAKMMSANSVDSYISSLEKSISFNGYVDVKNYSKVVKYLSEDLLEVHTLFSNDYEIPIDHGAISKHSEIREKIFFKVKNGKMLDTEKYSSFTEHFKFSDVEYTSAYELSSVIRKFQQQRKFKMIDPIDNYLEKKLKERNIEKYKHKKVYE